MAIKPDHVKALIALGRVELRLGHWRCAWRHHRQALKAEYELVEREWEDKQERTD